MRDEQRRLVSTSSLAVLVLSLGAYLYLVEVPQSRKSAEADVASKSLFDRNPAEASTVAISANGSELALTKHAGHWEVVQPIHARGDDLEIEKLLKALGDSKVDRVVLRHPSNLSDYGLDQPRTIVLGWGQHTETVQVGRSNPTDGFVFARRSKDGSNPPVVLADKTVGDDAGKSLYDLRDKFVLDLSTDELKSVTFDNRGRIVTITRASPGRWRVAEPYSAVADRGQIERSLELYTTLKAERFVSDSPRDLRQYGLDPPWGSAKFVTSVLGSRTILLGRKTTEGSLDRYFARDERGGPVFTINDNLARDVERAPEEWRDRHVTDFEKADVVELRVIEPTQTLVAAKTEDGTWRLAEYLGHVNEGMSLAAAAKSPSALRADADRVEELLMHLAALEVKQFAPAAASRSALGLDHPTLEVVALDKAGKRLAKLQLGKPTIAGVCGESAHLDQFFTLAAADVDRFRVGARQLAAR